MRWVLQLHFASFIFHLLSGVFFFLSFVVYPYAFIKNNFQLHSSYSPMCLTSANSSPPPPSWFTPSSKAVRWSHSFRPQDHKLSAVTTLCLCLATGGHQPPCGRAGAAGRCSFSASLLRLFCRVRWQAFAVETGYV